MRDRCARRVLHRSRIRSRVHPVAPERWESSEGAVIRRRRGRGVDPLHGRLRVPAVSDGGTNVAMPGPVVLAAAAPRLPTVPGPGIVHPLDARDG